MTVGRPVAVDPHPIIVGLSLNLSKGNPLYLSGKQAGLKPLRKVTGRCNFTSAISFFNVLLSNLEFQKRSSLTRAGKRTALNQLILKKVLVTVKGHQDSERG